MVLKESSQIQGIKVSLKTCKARETLARVLEQIRQRRPRDFQKIQERVMEVTPLPLKYNKARPVHRGYWEVDKLSDVRRGALFETIEEKTASFVPGRLAIDEQNPHLVAYFAHEFGHACTDYRDLPHRFDRTAFASRHYIHAALRKPGSEDALSALEWACELSANCYAYRWGFAKDIRRAGPWVIPSLPGDTGEVETDDGKFRFRITRNFVIHPVEW